MSKRLKERDVNNIKSLYFIHRFLPTSIAKLYNISHVTVINIVDKQRTITLIPDIECLLCGLENAQTYYIDGNEYNKKPQNIITLCEADFQRLKHLKMKKRRLTSQF